MNRKTITLAMSLSLSLFLGGVGCSTLPRPDVTGPGLLDVRGAALASNEVRITVRDVPDRPGVVYGVFSRLAAANIVVDMIVQNVAVEGRTSVSFTTAEHELTRTLELTEQAAKAVKAR